MKMRVTMILALLGGLLMVAVFSAGGCGSDSDPADPGGGDDGDGTWSGTAGESYVIPSFKVLEHGTNMQGIWKAGPIALSVGAQGRAIAITDVDRFILPTAETGIMRAAWFPESAAVIFIAGVYVVDNSATPVVLRFAGGLRYKESIDATGSANGIWAGDSWLVSAVIGNKLWWGRESGGWGKEKTFPNVVFDVWYNSQNVKFVAGMEGIFTDEDFSWDLIYVGSGYCRAIDGIDPDKIMAVYGEVVVVREGEGDFEVVFAAGAELFDVCWAEPDWAVAVGAEGIIVSYDGAVWTIHQMNSPFNLHGVTAWKDGDSRYALAVGESGSEYRYADGQWTGGYVYSPVWTDLVGDPTGATLFGIKTGIIFRYDDHSVEIPSPNEQIEFSEVFCTDADSVWAVGKSDIDTFLARYAGGEWNMSWLSSMENAHDIWVADKDHVFVACEYGTVYQSSPQGGMMPVSAVQPVQHLNGIWGASKSSVYVVGENGTICHYDGEQWTPMASGTAAHLLAVWGTSDSHVVAVGAGGVVLRWDGTTWHGMNSGIDANLTVVWTGGQDSIWAAGEDGSLLHFTGAAWETLPTGLEPRFRINGISGTGENLRVAGSDGILLEYVPPVKMPRNLWAP